MDSRDVGTAPPRLSLVCIMRDEVNYLVEWVAYHRLIGVDKLLVYDNGGNGQALAAMGESRTVEVIDWPSVEGISPQVSAYMDATERLVGETEFVGYFDADEFLVVQKPHTLMSWLSSLRADVSAVAVNQRVFGSNGHLSHGKGFVTQRFLFCCAESHDECRWFKTICRPEATVTPPTPHRSVMRAGRYVLPNGDSPFLHETGYADANGMVLQTDVVDFSILQLNHYILKSKAEFKLKRLRGGVLEPTEYGRSLRYVDEERFFHSRELYCNAVSSSALFSMYEQIRRYAETLGL